MELLVVMGLFSATVMMASDIFLISNRAQRRVLAVTAAQADLRFALEAIVREARMGRIDYAAYAASGGAVPIPSDRLIVKGPTGSEEQFYLETSPTVCPAKVTKCIAMTVDGSTPQSLTSIGNNIDTLAFYISPQSDPFLADPSSGLYAANAQPTVTIAVQSRTTGIGAQDVLTVNAETTTASRVYER
jgi:type II secretory pathway pseudopilin PulG